MYIAGKLHMQGALDVQNMVPSLWGMLLAQNTNFVWHILGKLAGDQELTNLSEDSSLYTIGLWHRHVSSTIVKFVTTGKCCS